MPNDGYDSYCSPNLNDQYKSDINEEEGKNKQVNQIIADLCQMIDIIHIVDLI